MLDDVEIDMAEPGARSIDLRKFDLSEGTHHLTVGEKSASFTVSASGNGLSWLTATHNSGYPFRRVSPTALDPLSLAAEVLPAAEAIPSGQLYISGARILYSAADPPPPRQHLLVLPYGARSYIVLGRYVGEVFERNLPTTQPPWKAGEFLRGYKLNIPFEPQWLVTISHGNNETLRPLGSPKKASQRKVQEAGCETWLRWVKNRRLSKRLSKKHRGWADMWIQYNDLARDFAG